MLVLRQAGAEHRTPTPTRQLDRAGLIEEGPLRRGSITPITLYVSVPRRSPVPRT